MAKLLAIAIHLARVTGVHGLMRSYVLEGRDKDPILGQSPCPLFRALDVDEPTEPSPEPSPRRSPRLLPASSMLMR